MTCSSRATGAAGSTNASGASGSSVWKRRYPTSSAYLGVLCLIMVLKRQLTPYYVLNIADEKVELTGLIEMTNLIESTDHAAIREELYSRLESF